jgi:uncharacterized protein YgiM (DUF1202 family)
LVENNEFAAISAKIKEMEDREANRRAEQLRQQQEQRAGEMQAQLEHEQAELDILKSKEQQLQSELSKRQGVISAHVRTASADLKAAPYTEAKTVQLLAQGDAVTVLSQRAGWYRVQAANGKAGWIYRLMLEVAQ